MQDPATASCQYLASLGAAPSSTSAAQSSGAHAKDTNHQTDGRSPSAQQNTTPLFGLSAPFAEVEAFIRGTVEGQENSSALLVGPAGCGKREVLATVLRHAFASSASASGGPECVVLELDGNTISDDAAALSHLAQGLQLNKDAEAYRLTLLALGVPPTSSSSSPPSAPSPQPQPQHRVAASPVQQRPRSSGSGSYAHDNANDDDRVSVNSGSTGAVNASGAGRGSSRKGASQAGALKRLFAEARKASMRWPALCKSIEHRMSSAGKDAIERSKAVVLAASIADGLCPGAAAQSAVMRELQELADRARDEQGTAAAADALQASAGSRPVSPALDDDRYSAMEAGSIADELMGYQDDAYADGDIDVDDSASAVGGRGRPRSGISSGRGRKRSGGSGGASSGPRSSHASTLSSYGLQVAPIAPSSAAPAAGASGSAVNGRIDPLTAAVLKEAAGGGSAHSGSASHGFGKGSSFGGLRSARSRGAAGRGAASDSPLVADGTSGGGRRGVGGGTGGAGSGVGSRSTSPAFGDFDDPALSLDAATIAALAASASAASSSAKSASAATAAAASSSAASAAAGAAASNGVGGGGTGAGGSKAAGGLTFEHNLDFVVSCLRNGHIQGMDVSASAASGGEAKRFPVYVVIKGFDVFARR